MTRHHYLLRCYIMQCSRKLHALYRNLVPLESIRKCSITSQKDSDLRSHQHKDLKSLTELYINSKHINSKSRNLEYDFLITQSHMNVKISQGKFAIVTWETSHAWNITSATIRLDFQVQHTMTAPSTILSPLYMLTLPVFYHANVLHYATVYTTAWKATMGTSRPGSFTSHPSCKYKILLTLTLLHKFFQCTLLILYHHAHVCVCKLTSMRLSCPFHILNQEIVMRFGKKELLLVVN